MNDFEGFKRFYQSVTGVPWEEAVKGQNKGKREGKLSHSDIHINKKEPTERK